MISANMIAILGILLEETYEIGILPDRLPRQLEIVLAEVETVHVIMAATHVVVFALALLAQHQIVKDHEILASGIEISRIGHVARLLEEERFDSTGAGWRLQDIHRVDQRVGIAILDGEKVADIVFRKSFPQRLPQQLIDGLMERFSEDEEAIVIELSIAQEEIIQQSRLATVRLPDNQASDRPLWEEKVIPSGCSRLIIGDIFDVHFI